MTSNIFPALRYRDGHAAIDWLVRTFGFEKQAVFDSPDGGVAHAQLRFGPGVLSLSSTQATGPDNPWSGVRQGIYVHVKEVDAHHDRARAAGASVVSPLKDLDYGSREYAVRDPEGHTCGGSARQARLSRLRRSTRRGRVAITRATSTVFCGASVTTSHDRSSARHLICNRFSRDWTMEGDDS
jgi:uncharacterized glyoxalase superfamily protein PhnB